MYIGIHSEFPTWPFLICLASLVCLACLRATTYHFGRWPRRYIVLLPISRQPRTDLHRPRMSHRPYIRHLPIVLGNFWSTFEQLFSVRASLSNFFLFLQFLSKFFLDSKLYSKKYWHVVDNFIPYKIFLIQNELRHYAVIQPVILCCNGCSIAAYLFLTLNCWVLAGLSVSLLIRNSDLYTTERLIYHLCTVNKC